MRRARGGISVAGVVDAVLFLAQGVPVVVEVAVAGYLLRGAPTSGMIRGETCAEALT
jgi:hypothetical protein